MNDFYAIYLRKSRADTELEKLGQGETLARHRATLLELAEKRQYHISHIYQEIVSGDSIISRPQMQELMRAVENGEYNGVLVMEIERLARGDTIDQGLVAQTFKSSGTLIVTPSKTYDPNNEFDENFFEFSLFMSRQEFKTIKRRLKQGKYASAKEGKWLAPVPPYGYKRIPVEGQKGFTLEPIEEQAAIVRMIFDLYVNGLYGRRYGIQAIAHHLNEIGIPPARRDYWQKETIRDMLNNPVYAGKIRYGYRKTHQITVDGHRKSTRPISLNDDYVLVDGLHPPIISIELYQQAQELADLRPLMPVGYKKEIKNPLAGLIICKLCGRRMTFRRASAPNKPDYLVCHARACTNVSSPLAVVENKLLTGIEQWVKSYELQLSAPDTSHTSAQIEAIRTAISVKDKDIGTLQKQLTAAFDLLEQGVYSADDFKARKSDLSSRLETARADLVRLTDEAARVKKQERLSAEYLPRVKSLLQAYYEAETPATKNELLREILDHAEYRKEKSAAYRGIAVDDFELDIFPRLPNCE